MPTEAAHRHPAVRTARRLPHLDAVRGLAALVVMAHHAWLALPPPRWQGVPNPVLDLVVLGRPAVILFFVLSGYVLTLSWQAAPSSPVRFALRRLLRILPPYWAAIAVAYLLYLLSPSRPLSDLSPWFVEQWHRTISPVDLPCHLLLLAGPRQFPLNHVAWSLVHELRFSLLVPFAVLLARRWGSLAGVAAAAAATLAAEGCILLHPAPFPAGVHGFLFDAQGIGWSLVMSARFSLTFMLGVAAATEAAAIASACRRWPLSASVAMIVAVLMLSRGSEAAMTAGAAMLVPAAAASAGLERALALPFFTWLGRVSYSLYLLHLPIMLASAARLDGLLPPAAILAIAMALSFVAADLFFRLVERPAIRLSRSVGRLRQASVHRLRDDRRGAASGAGEPAFGRVPPGPDDLLAEAHLGVPGGGTPR